jgi:hypothetical protein
VVEPAAEPSTRLPPIPDRLVSARMKDAFLGWLSGQAIPTRYRLQWATKWAAVVGVELERADLELLGLPPADRV